MDMRGLAHFIQDIRKATGNRKEEEDRVDEELAKIRATFVDTTHMSTYQRKKYVCKLMFISMLGYPITFGHMEGVRLMAEQTPAEKLIGYLSTNVLMTEESGILTLTTHTVYKDLMSGLDFNRGLALNAIASTGGRDFAETMVGGVQNIILDDHADLHLRMKAMLTLLRMHNRDPDLVDLPTIVPKVGALLECGQEGAIMCAVTFLNGCIRKQNEHIFGGIPGKLIDILHRIIIDKQTDPGYVYYGVPAPWLQSKVLRFLQYFPSPQDTDLRGRVVTVIRKIVKATDKVLREAQTQQKQRGTQNRVSAMNAVLFEVISLCIQWEISSSVILDCVNIISSFISDKKEANLRYLGLTLLSRLSFTEVAEFDFQAYCKQYQQYIIVGLHDADVSIRKKALEVMVAMCNSANYNDIIREILSFLPIAQDPVFRSGLVISIAFLAEKYSDDENWFVNILLTVIAQAGDTCLPEIAYRAVQVIVADPSVQKRAASIVFSVLRTKKYLHPLLVRTTAFILGEFGYQIALNPESTPLIQLSLLQEQLAFSATETQAVILTTLFKFYNLYDSPAVRERVVKVLCSYRTNSSAELQGRATEYLALINNGDPGLIAKVLEPIPLFSAQTAATLTKVRMSHGSNDLWSTKLLERGNAVAANAPKSEKKRKAIKLQNLSSSSKRTDRDTERDAEIGKLFVIAAPPDAAAMTARFREQRRSFSTLLTHAGEGVLYADGAVEVRCHARYTAADVRLEMTVRNCGAAPVTAVSVLVLSVELGLLLESRSTAADSLAPGGTLVVEFAGRCLAPFVLPPSVQLRYQGQTGAQLQVLSLPVSAARFVTPYETTGESETAELIANVKSASGILSRDLAKSRQGTIARVLAALGSMGYTACRDCAVSAHVTQPEERLEYSPVVCEVTESRAGVRVTVFGNAPALQRSLLDFTEAIIEADA